MKTKEQKRKEAIERAKNYTYANSKAKRKGISEQDWEKSRWPQQD